MNNFLEFKTAIQYNIECMVDASTLMVVDGDKEDLWDLYLDSFPEGTNEIFRERREYDCSCCKQFIKNIGLAVTINADYSLSTIWDNINLGNEFDVVAEALRNYVLSKKVVMTYRADSTKIGTDHNDEVIDGKVVTWDHFYAEIPSRYAITGERVGKNKSLRLDNYNVLERSLETITPYAIDQVMALIGELYKGVEYKAKVESLQAVKAEYATIPTHNLHNWLWLKSLELGEGGRFRNSVIGSLLIDISEDMDLVKAVERYEQKVDPRNFQRSSKAVSALAIVKAKEKIEEYGLMSAMERRHAQTTDVSIGDVLYASADTAPEMDAFDKLIAKAPVKNLSNHAEEMSISDFMANVVTESESIELLFEKTHISRLMSITAPIASNVNRLFKWDNNFAWSYRGDVTDSIKERVKAAGGSIDGILRASLSWSNSDDLDIHVIEPNGNRICFSSSESHTGGRLDVDMNASRNDINNVDPVENITWNNSNKMDEGDYAVIVNNYSKRSSFKVGFQVQIAAHNTTHTLSSNTSPKGSANIDAVTFSFTKAEGITNIRTTLSRDTSDCVEWGITTKTFVPVNMIMKSPNYWGSKGSGNEHLFFILDKCLNPDPVRGFFNEYLNPVLHEDRKVFEQVAEMMRAPYADEQLSGLGFSSTLRASAQFRVNGSKIIKVNF